MRSLHLGMIGQDVEQWQIFLRGRDPYSELVATGIFDAETDVATRAFQSEKGLGVDGWVGNYTFGAALSEGYGIVSDANSVDYGPSWPQRPSFYSMS